MSYQNKSVILFDGVCNLCNASINFILKRDKNKYFMFSSLQSDATKNILLQFEPKIIKNNLDSIVLIDNNKVFIKSTAILFIAKKMGFPYNLSFGFILIPRIIRDFIYDFIARNRYRWFGKKSICRLPKKEELERFLN